MGIWPSRKFQPSGVLGAHNNGTVCLFHGEGDLMLQDRAQAKWQDWSQKGLLFRDQILFLSSTEQTLSLRGYGGNYLHSTSIPGLPE